MRKLNKLSIIIPVYNEEKTLEIIISKVQKVKIPKIEKEIIIVNDASTDNTQKIIDKLEKKYKNIKSLKHEKNKGKGASIKTGLKYISGDILVIQDGDLEYNPEDFKRLIKPILYERAKVVYGSRMLNKQNKYSYLSAYIGNRIINKIANFLFNFNLTDIETCYKMMKKEVLDEIDLESNRYDFEIEITSKISKKGYMITEIPISYSPRSFEDGKKINWKDGVVAIYKLFKYRFIT